MPARQYGGQRPLRQPMVVAGGIMREDHLSGVASAAHFRYSLDAVFKRENGVYAEAVHTDVGAVVGQLFQVGEVGSITGVSDHHAREINTLLAKDPLLVEPHAP